jgi:flagellar biosynthesis chaperone FliJ
MAAAVRKLHDAVDAATTGMLRAGSTLGTSLAENTQRIEAEVAQVLAAIEGQRKESTEALHAAQTASASIREEASTQLQAHLSQWKLTLDQARSAMADAHRALDEEYKRGLAGFSSTGAAFAELAERAAKEVEALPNPADRLVGLWDGVRGLETTLAESLGGVLRELTTLRERSEQLAKSLQVLSGSADSAAASVGAGGARLGEALQRELQQMNGIIEEYTSLLERTTGALAGETRQ